MTQDLDLAAELDVLVEEHIGDRTPAEVDALERELREDYPKVKRRWEEYVKYVNARG